MANTASTKKQIIDSIKQTNSILVAVSRNPSVDELSAALGLTIFLNNLEKHATAVFSGDMPPAIGFLEPQKTFEDTADSLRDFIIALDKEKADHLRYKVVEDSVKIFITPYRTTITEDDLEFSQGDYNVELVIALNVEKHDYLDAALTAHGKILHDAEVMTITAGQVNSDLGTADWHDGDASGVSEMIVSLVNELKTQKTPIDEQIATALLTGIVSATDRFGNEVTSPKAMTAAATLMAAGANQQLIAIQLEKAEEAEEAASEDEVLIDKRPVKGIDGSTFMTEGASSKVHSMNQQESSEDNNEEDNDSYDDDGTITITRDKNTDIDDVARQVMEQKQKQAAKKARSRLEKLSRLKKRQPEPEPEVVEQPQPDPEPEPEPEPQPEPQPEPPAEPELDFIEEPIPSPSTTSEQPVVEPEVIVPVPPSPPDIAEDLRRTTEQMVANNEQNEPPTISPSVGMPSVGQGHPTVGGTLNATTAQAAEEKRRAAALDQNRTILKHGKPIGSRVPVLQSGTFNATMGEPDSPPTVDVFAVPPPEAGGYRQPTEAQPIYQPEYQQQPQSDPNQMYDQGPVMQQMEQPAPVFAQDAGVPNEPNFGPTLADLEQQSAASAPPPPPMPPMPPMPDFNSLPPLPSMPPGVDPAGLPSLPNVAPNQPVQAPQDFNPSQFQIPPQQ